MWRKTLFVSVTAIALFCFIPLTGSNSLTAKLGTGMAASLGSAIPAQTADTGTIMFVGMTDQSRLGDNAIYSVNSDGTNLKRLTMDGDQILSVSPLPKWSPDGQRIAYVNWRQGLDGGLVAVELYVMDRDSANRHLLMNVAESSGQATQQITGLAWSPDGKMLAVTRLASGLFLLPANGQDKPRLVLRDAGKNFSSPAWSPDGKRVALYLYGNGGGSLSEIHVVNADGSGDTRVSSPVIQERTVQTGTLINWSQDGNTLYFALLDSTSKPAVWAVHASNADGSGDIQLKGAGPRSRYLLVSPDGRRIAFSEGRNIFVMNIDGSDVRQLTTDSDWACSSVEWSPNGKRLVMSCHFVKDECRLARGCRWRIFWISPDDPSEKLSPIIDRDATYPSVAPAD